MLAWKFDINMPAGRPLPASHLRHHLAVLQEHLEPSLVPDEVVHDVHHLFENVFEGPMGKQLSVDL
jgi:hypothetical protein